MIGYYVGGFQMTWKSTFRICVNCRNKDDSWVSSHPNIPSEFGRYVAQHSSEDSQQRVVCSFHSEMRSNWWQQGMERV